MPSVVDRRLSFVALIALLACNGSTQPPGPPAQVVKAGGDNQQWFFNNVLPTPYSVSVTDANARAVPDVPVKWAIMVGGGTLSTDSTNTDALGIAATLHTLAGATTYVVSATVLTLPQVVFTTTASAPPSTVGVDVKDNRFDLAKVAVQVNGTVTWTWSGANPHSVTFGNGTPTSPTQTSGTYSRQFTSVGSFDYHCTVHTGMTGTVTVVN